MNDFDSKEDRLELNDYFLKIRNLRILVPVREDKTKNPTIVYIPNKRMEDAEAVITRVYNEGNYNEIYRLPQELCTAIPMTAARWKALREEDLQ